MNKANRTANSLKHTGWGNALLSWELLRVSRRTAALTIGRFAFGAALLGVMWLLYSARFADQEKYTGDIAQLAKQLQKFAEEFSLTFFLVQLTLVLLLTPIFVAGSVFEERETRSGEVLLTTDLTRREVFYGKFLARVVQVMLVVAAGMPVLALTLLWGGVAIQFIIAGYVATFMCIFSSGAIAASVAGSSETLRHAVLKAYGCILVFDVLIFPASPFLLIAMMSNEVSTAICFGVAFVPLQIGITLIALAHGLRWLRLAMLRQRRRITDELAAEMASRKPPVAEDDALVWKERHVGVKNELTQVSMFCSAAVPVGVVFLVIPGNRIFPSGWVAEFLCPFAILLASVVIGLSAAGSVARERQKNTLIDLFMIPGARRAILRAKVLGAFWNARWLLGAVGVLLPISVIGGTPLVAVPFLAIAAAGFLIFSAALGTWLSVRCRTMLNANAAWMGFMSASLIGTFLLADAMSYREPTPNGRYTTVFPEWSEAANPLMGWQQLTMSPGDETPTSPSLVDQIRSRLLPTKAPHLLAPLTGIGIYALAAGALWLLGLRRFEREGREE